MAVINASGKFRSFHSKSVPIVPVPKNVRQALNIERMYKKQIKNIEIYGGMSQEKNTMQDDEEEYNEIGIEPINLGEPNIVDQDDSLGAVADEKELSQELLKFLEKEGEERRNFYAVSVESTGEKDYKAVLDFSTKRSDGKNISITFENGIYTFAFK